MLIGNTSLVCISRDAFHGMWRSVSTNRDGARGTNIRVTSAHHIHSEHINTLQKKREQERVSASLEEKGKVTEVMQQALQE